MSMSTKAPTIKSPPIAVCDAIVRRFLKPDQNIFWGREMPAFHNLFKLYPDVKFWQTHELAFKLNHMSWFSSVEGKAHLEHAWVLFNYTPPPITDPILDNGPQGVQDSGVLAQEEAPQFIAPPRRARTVAEMMAKQPSSSIPQQTCQLSTPTSVAP